MEKVKQHKINPYWTEYGNHIHEIKRTIRTKGVREGIIDGKSALISNDDRAVEFEYTNEYVKINNSGLDMLTVLSKQGIMVLAYIVQHCLEFNKDSFIFVSKRCVDRTRSSQSNISRGLRDLLENEVIAATDSKVVYWLNINLLHKGDLENRYKEFVQTTMR